MVIEKLHPWGFCLHYRFMCVGGEYEWYRNVYTIHKGSSPVVIQIVEGK